MNKITIIQLLNKIANGEEVPEHIRYRNWNNNSFEIMFVCKENIFYKLDQLEIFLNDEVEILDEENEFEDIEELSIKDLAISINEIYNDNVDVLMGKINDLIKNQKKIIDKLNKE